MSEPINMEWVLNQLRTLQLGQSRIEGINDPMAIALRRAIGFIETESDETTRLKEVIAKYDQEITRLRGIAAKYAREHTEFESLEKLATHLDACQRGLMAELADERKRLQWWREHTEQLEKNWERLVEIARQERNRAISALVRIRAMAGSICDGVEEMKAAGEA